MKSLDYIRANGKQGLGAIIGMTGATAAKIAGAAESFRVRVLLVDVEGCCSSAAVWGEGLMEGGGREEERRELSMLERRKRGVFFLCLPVRSGRGEKGGERGGGGNRGMSKGIIQSERRWCIFYHRLRSMSTQCISFFPIVAFPPLAIPWQGCVVALASSW